MADVQTEPSSAADEGTAAAEPPLRDKPPKPRGKRKATPGQKASSAAGGANVAMKSRSRVLERKLAELLAFPAVPAAMLAESDPMTQAYMLEHFTRSGPRTAAVLVEASESNPTLRALLERITAGGSMMTVVVALVAYGGPPVMWLIGMREQAARFTMTTTATPEELQSMMVANAAAAAESAGHNGPASAAPAAGAGPLDE